MMRFIAQTFASVKYFHLVFTILVPIVLLSDIVIILISVIFTLMILDMKVLLLTMPILYWDKLMTLTEAKTNIILVP